LFEVKSFALQARQIHQKETVFDGHCDTILEITNHKRSLADKACNGHLDISRLREGGVDIQVFAIFVEDNYKPFNSLKRTLQLLDYFLDEIEKNSDAISLVINYNQIKETNKAGKIAAILAIEGGESLEGDLAVLKVLYRLGVRLLTLTWNYRNEIADGLYESRTGGGLTEFGIKIIEEMNKLGMIIDVSHLSEAGFWDVIKFSKSPIIASHSNCFNVCSHWRNLKDEQIKAVADKNGVIGITYVPAFLTKDERKATIEDVVRNIDYIVKKVGIDYVGLGSDFDGVENLPLDLEGIEKIPNITAELLKQGYKEEYIRKILGGNFLRVFKEVVG